MEWANVPREEQETIINIDYYDRSISVYTSRKIVAEKLMKKVGQPSSVDTIDGKIANVIFEMPLSNKRIRQFLLIGNIIGGFRNDNTDEQVEQSEEE